MKSAPSFQTTLIWFLLCFQVSYAQVPTFPNQIFLQQFSITESMNGTYVSREGLFQIGVTLPFPYEGELAGFSFREGEIKFRYFDFGLDRGEGSFDFFNSQCEIFELDTLKNIPGRIVSKTIASKTNPYDSTALFAFEDGRFGIERHVMRKKRLYVILAVVNEFLDQPNFQRAVESFATTADIDPDAVLKMRMDRLTWSPFPQTPETPGQRTDLDDDNMKGQVAKVIDFYSDKQGNKTGIHFINEYDRHGYNVREIKYDQYGLPYEIEYSGFLDGKQVTKMATINEDLSLFKPWDSDKPRDTPEDYDPKLGYDARYLYSTSKTYRDGKLMEKIFYSGAGKAWYRWVFDYKGATTIVTDYVSGALRSTRVLESFDRKGNLTSELYYPGLITATSPTRRLLSYQYDKNGNWIKRSSCWVPKELTKCPANSIADEYREISFY